MNIHGCRIVEKMGGATLAAKKINKLNKNPRQILNRVTVQKWKNNGIPTKWISAIKKVTGLSEKEINPNPF